LRPISEPNLDSDNVRTLPRRIVYDSLFANKIGKEDEKRKHFDQLFGSTAYILSVQQDHLIRRQEFKRELERVHPLIERASIALSAHHDHCLGKHSAAEREFVNAIQKIRTQLGEDNNPFKIAEATGNVKMLSEAQMTNSIVAQKAKKYYELASEYLFYFDEFKRAIDSEIELFEEYVKYSGEAIGKIRESIAYFRRLPARKASW
jgi:hypothetical protein